MNEILRQYDVRKETENAFSSSQYIIILWFALMSSGGAILVFEMGIGYCQEAMSRKKQCHVACALSVGTYYQKKKNILP